MVDTLNNITDHNSIQTNQTNQVFCCLCMQEPRSKIPLIFPSLPLSAVPPSFDEDISAATNKSDGTAGHL